MKTRLLGQPFTPFQRSSALQYHMTSYLTYGRPLLRTSVTERHQKETSGSRRILLAYLRMFTNEVCQQILSKFVNDVDLQHQGQTFRM